VSVEAASLGLALYVLACRCPSSVISSSVLDAETHFVQTDGTGPLLFSPLSEYVFLSSRVYITLMLTMIPQNPCRWSQSTIYHNPAHLCYSLGSRLAGQKFRGTSGITILNGLLWIALSCDRRSLVPRYCTYQLQAALIARELIVAPSSRSPKFPIFCPFGHRPPLLDQL
jgi:hypothetical protein